MRARRIVPEGYAGDDPWASVGRQHRIPRRDDEVCIHPRRAVRWNPYNEAYQCHQCGQIMDDDEDEKP